MEESAHILVVDDEGRITRFLKRGLEFEGYQTTVAESGKEALVAIASDEPDLVLLDVMLPDIDGVTVCRTIRDNPYNFTNPILMLTAKELVEDRVAGLDAGADDYLVKPFAFDELAARIRALLRRVQPNEPAEGAILAFEDLVLDTGTRRGQRGGEVFDLTAKEYELLLLFMMNPRRVLTREDIFESVWQYDFGGESNIIEVYVRYLRQKTEMGDRFSRLIHTVRGTGYVLREAD